VLTEAYDDDGVRVTELSTTTKLRIPRKRKTAVNHIWASSGRWRRRALCGDAQTCAEHCTRGVPVAASDNAWEDGTFFAVACSPACNGTSWRRGGGITGETILLHISGERLGKQATETHAS